MEKLQKNFPLEFAIGYVEDSSNELEYFLDKELELNQLNGYNMYDKDHHFEFLKPDRIPESFKYTVYDTLIEEDVQGYGKRTPKLEDYHSHEKDRLLYLLENDRDRFQKYNWVDENNNLIFPTYDCDWFGMRTNLVPKDGISLSFRM